jgi:predicted nucleotidyltransferase
MKMLLFSCEYGSRAMGMSTEDSDHDMMAVYLEPREYITGLSTWHAKHSSTAEDGQRSTAKDTDTTVYGLKHWATLAAKGNPTAMTPLFVVGENREYSDLGWKILQHAHLFISKDAGRQYFGYAKGQRDALLGLRNKKTNRPELIHKHGYDTKFAYHALRTLMQGNELMRTVWVELPIPEYNAETLRMIRAGKVGKETFIELFIEYEEMMQWALDNTSLPEHADYDSINSLLHDVYTEGWRSE